MPQEMPAKEANHFENLKDFLSSAEAAKALSAEQLNAMKQEIAAAQVREAYWSGVLSSEISESGDAPVPESSDLVPLQARGVASWAVSDHVSQDPTQSGKWTLWTFVNPALRREDFSSELHARTALSSRNETPGAAPCILRDPSGRMLVASSWRTSRA